MQQELKILWSRLHCFLHSVDGVIEHSAIYFAYQFTNKVERIRVSTVNALAPHITKRSMSEPLTHIEPVTSDEVVKVLKTAPTK